MASRRGHSTRLGSQNSDAGYEITHKTGVHGGRQALPRAATTRSAPAGGTICHTSMGRRSRPRRSTAKSHTALHAAEPHGGTRCPTRVKQWEYRGQYQDGESSPPWVLELEALDSFTRSSWTCCACCEPLGNLEARNCWGDVVEQRHERSERKHSSSHFLLERG